jgi:acyl phosphate:glycerol-3-phosphate acyltransferase
VEALTIALLTLGAYLSGSIPVGVIVGKLRGFDPRTTGSGNIGMANVARAGGKGPAAFTFIGDALKSFVPVEIARYILGPVPPILALVGLAAFTGAIASVFLKLRGGRGVASSVGVWVALAPAPLAIALGVFVVLIALSRIVSLASIAAALSLPPATAALGCPRAYILLAIMMTALVLLRHSENIARLIRGEEPSLRSARGPG